MSRTRSRSNSSGTETLSTSSSYYRTFPNDPSRGRELYGTNTGSSTVIQSKSEEVMTDTVTPGFKKLSSKGSTVFSPLQKTKTETLDYATPFTRNDVVWYPNSNTKKSFFEETLHTGTVASSYLLNSSYSAIPDVSSTRNRAITSAFSNVSLSDANVIATLGESKQTIISLVSALRSVHKIFFRFSRTRTELLFKFKKMKKADHVKLLADLWMKARYELRPLYYECMGYAKALQAEPKPRFRQTFRGFAEDSGTLPDAYVDKAVWYRTIKSKTTARFTVQCRAGVLTDVNGASLKMSLGVYEIPQGLWELVPYSFVLDWFINMGDLIASWTPKPQFKVLGSWVTTTVTTTYTTTMSGITISKPYNPSKTESWYSHSLIASPILMKTITSVKREINPARPVLPEVSVNLSMAKLIDIGIMLKNLA